MTFVMSSIYSRRVSNFWLLNVWSCESRKNSLFCFPESLKIEFSWNEVEKNKKDIHTTLFCILSQTLRLKTSLKEKELHLYFFSNVFSSLLCIFLLFCLFYFNITFENFIPPLFISRVGPAKQFFAHCINLKSRYHESAEQVIGWVSTLAIRQYQLILWSWVGKDAGLPGCEKTRPFTLRSTFRMPQLKLTAPVPMYSC